MTCAYISATDLAAVNDYLSARGHGEGNFSVPLSSDGSAADYTGCHWWSIPAFDADMQAAAQIYAIEIVDDGVRGPGVAFGAEASALGLRWEDPALWFENPVMTGDQRTYDGKTWESLIDFNVWSPPVGWREVVSEGYPEWVQPSGSHDAYNIGDRVTFEGSDYESLINANVWSPTVLPSGWQLLP